MKKTLETIGTVIALVVAVAVGIIIANFTQSQIDKPRDLGSIIATNPVPLAYSEVATSTLSSYNGFNIGTSTPTTTDYAYFGAEVDQVDMFMWVQATSTDNRNLAWKISFSPFTRDTSTMDFYNEDVVISEWNDINRRFIHTSSTPTHLLTLKDSTALLKKVNICGSSYDGTDDSIPCNAGWYKIEIGRPDGKSAFELYTTVVGKQY